MESMIVSLLTVGPD